MKEKPDEQYWQNEFRAFLDAPEVEPARAVSEELRRRVRRDLEPPLWAVFGKLAAIALVAGMASLLLCPQFGLGGNMGLMVVFMNFGQLACMAMCGGFFVGSGVLAAGLSMRPEELRAIRKNQFLSVSAVSLLGVSAFVCLGAEVLAAVTLLWLLGAVLGGLLALQLSYLTRIGLPQRRQLECE